MLYENGLFIFRRDYRLTDNHGLDTLNSLCKNIYTIFIFTPEQVGKNNDYKSNNAVQFMIEGLNDLSENIKSKGGNLYTFYGENNTVIKKLIDDFDINIVCFNRDITPYALNRDNVIVELCNKKNVEVKIIDDYFLFPVGSILSGSGENYQKFTPFYENCLKHKVEIPSKSMKLKLTKKHGYSHNNNSYILSLNEAQDKFTKHNPNLLIYGSRKEAVKVLKNAVKNQHKYKDTRDELHINTSLLSAYIKFGLVSIREVYYAFKGNHDFIRQLFWRDFYANILWAFPHVLKKPFKLSYQHIKWHKNERWFQAWCKGTTGVPMVDACMRQLNTVGWMHNRGRMIVSSFLTQIMLIDYKLGEKYFAQKLVDYDVANNNGGWQSSSSIGTDSGGYIRIMNPWNQSIQHDSDCVYIKRWIPELGSVPNEDIHKWDTSFQKYGEINYPSPILNYKEQREKALKMYSDARN